MGVVGDRFADARLLHRRSHRGQPHAIDALAEKIVDEHHITNAPDLTVRHGDRSDPFVLGLAFVRDAQVEVVNRCDKYGGRQIIV